TALSPGRSKQREFTGSDFYRHFLLPSLRRGTKHSGKVSATLAGLRKRTLASSPGTPRGEATAFLNLPLISSVSKSTSSSLPLPRMFGLPRAQLRQFLLLWQRRLILLRLGWLTA